MALPSLQTVHLGEEAVSDLRKRYFAALKEVAIGMFVTIFRNGFFVDFWKAIGDFAWHLAMLFVWLLSLATYPVSIFFFAGLSVYSDIKREERQRAVFEEFASNDWRKR
jgi:hypothetical protein